MAPPSVEPKPLSVTEERLRLITENILEVFWIADPSISQMLYISPGYERVWGRSCASLYADPRSFGESIHPDDQQRVFRVLEDQKRGLPFDHQYRILHTDGTVRWIWDRGFPVRGADGTVVSYVGVAQDITTQKRAADTVAFQANVLNRVEHAIVVTDPQDRITYWNPSAERLYGWTAEEVLGRDALELAVPEDARDAARAIVATVLGGRTWSGEFVIRRRDGHLFPASITDSPLLDEDGRVVGVICVASDITERRAAENAIREAGHLLEQRVQQRTAEIESVRRVLEVATEATHLGICELNVDTGVMKWNDQMFRLHGVDPVTFQPTLDTFRDFVHPDDRARVEEGIGIVTSGGVWPGTRHRIVRRDGTLRYVQCGATFVKLGEDDPGVVVGSVQDVTEETIAAEDLRRSEEELRRFVDYAPAAIAMFDTEMRYVAVSGRWKTHFLLSGQALLGRSHYEVFPDQPAHWKEAHRAALAGTVRKADREQITLRDGSTTWTRWEVHPWRTASGGIGGILLFSEDITEQMQAEETLRRSQDLLRQANGELERALLLKDEFLSSMSHELRTPLNGILGLSEALEDGVYGTLSRDQISALQMVRESGHHLLEVINDILDLSKSEAGKLELTREVLTVEAVAETSIHIIKQQADAKGIRLHVTMGPGVDCVRADRRRLKQMLVNLLDNAVKFTAPGGQVGLEVTRDTSRKVVRFSVWDDGPGIADDKLPLLFQPFSQVESGLARRHGGTGLGLALVRRMAEMHGGTAGVESKFGAGSRFFFELPWQPTDAQERVVRDVEDFGSRSRARQAHTPGRDHGRTGPLVLIADDNPINRRAAEDMLQSRGYRVATAANGLEALERTVTTQPSLVLMDIQMPVMDGLEAIRRLRARAEGGTVPILALTALAMPGDRERCLAAGANEYLSKPFSLKALVAAVDRMVRPRDEPLPPSAPGGTRSA